MSPGKTQFSCRINFRTKNKVLESGTSLIPGNTQRTLHNPVGDTSESIVVEGVHTVVSSETIVFGIGIQTLPYRSSPLLYRIEPGRELCIEKHLIGIVTVTGLAESHTDPCRTDEPGHQRIFRISLAVISYTLTRDGIEKVMDKLILILILDNAKSQRNGIRSLGINKDTLTLRTVLSSER